MGLVFQVARPQNLEKLSLEELHQRKHDLKQEDGLPELGCFLETLCMKQYEAHEVSIQYVR